MHQVIAQRNPRMQKGVATTQQHPGQTGQQLRAPPGLRSMQAQSLQGMALRQPEWQAAAHTNLRQTGAHSVLCLGSGRLQSWPHRQRPGLTGLHCKPRAALSRPVRAAAMPFLKQPPPLRGLSQPMSHLGRDRLQDRPHRPMPGLNGLHGRPRAALKRILRTLAAPSQQRQHSQVMRGQSAFQSPCTGGISSWNGPSGRGSMRAGRSTWLSGRSSMCTGIAHTCRGTASLAALLCSNAHSWQHA